MGNVFPCPRRRSRTLVTSPFIGGGRVEPLAANPVLYSPSWVPSAPPVQALSRSRGEEALIWDPRVSDFVRGTAVPVQTSCLCTECNKRCQHWSLYHHEVEKNRRAQLHIERLRGELRTLEVRAQIWDQQNREVWRELWLEHQKRVAAEEALRAVEATLSNPIPSSPTTPVRASVEGPTGDLRGLTNVPLLPTEEVESRCYKMVDDEGIQHPMDASADASRSNPSEGLRWRGTGSQPPPEENGATLRSGRVLRRRMDYDSLGGEVLLTARERTSDEEGRRGPHSASPPPLSLNRETSSMRSMNNLCEPATPISVASIQGNQDQWVDGSFGRRVQQEARP